MIMKQIYDLFNHIISISCGIHRIIDLILSRIYNKPRLPHLSKIYGSGDPGQIATKAQYDQGLFSHQTQEK